MKQKVLKKEKQTLVKVGLWVEDYQDQALKQLSSDTGFSQSEMLRNIINYYLDTHTVYVPKK